jgi:hypothetical protein
MFAQTVPVHSDQKIESNRSWLQDVKFIIKDVDNNVKGKYKLANCLIVLEFGGFFLSLSLCSVQFSVLGC